MDMDAQDIESKKTRFMLRPSLLTIALPLLAACSYPWVTPGTSIQVLFFVAFLLSFACVVGIWLGLGNRWWRFLIAPFVITLSAFALGFSAGGGFDWIGVSISAIMTFIIWITLEFTKLVFGRFEIPNSQESTTDGLQFGISHLMITTAVVALSISCVKLLVKYAESRIGSSPSDFYSIAAMFISVLVLITLTGMWALLGNFIKYKLLIATAISIFAMVAAPLLITIYPSTPLLFTGLFFICWITITSQLWLLRLEGLRFVRK